MKPKRKLLSTKWQSAYLACAIAYINNLNGNWIDVTALGFIIAPLAIYIIVEGAVDFAKVWNSRS
jgi:hypothetical protein